MPAELSCHGKYKENVQEGLDVFHGSLHFQWDPCYKKFQGFLSALTIKKKRSPVDLAWASRSLAWLFHLHHLLIVIFKSRHITEEHNILRAIAKYVTKVNLETSMEQLNIMPYVCVGVIHMTTAFNLLSHSLGISSVVCKTAFHLSLVKMKCCRLFSFRHIKKKCCLLSPAPKAFLNVIWRKTSEDYLLCSLTTAYSWAGKFYWYNSLSLQNYCCSPRGWECKYQKSCYVDPSVDAFWADAQRDFSAI